MVDGMKFDSSIQDVEELFGSFRAACVTYILGKMSRSDEHYFEEWLIRSHRAEMFSAVVVAEAAANNQSHVRVPFSEQALES